MSNLKHNKLPTSPTVPVFPAWPEPSGDDGLFPFIFDFSYQPRGGCMLRTRAWIGLEILGIVIGGACLFLWWFVSAVVSRSGYREWGASWDNLANWLQETNGLRLLLLVAVAVLFFSTVGLSISVKMALTAGKRVV
jgi:hypothetical protein